MTVNEQDPLQKKNGHSVIWVVIAQQVTFQFPLQKMLLLA